MGKVQWSGLPAEFTAFSFQFIPREEGKREGRKRRRPHNWPHFAVSEDSLFILTNTQPIAQSAPSANVMKPTALANHPNPHSSNRPTTTTTTTFSSASFAPFPQFHPERAVNGRKTSVAFTRLRPLASSRASNREVPLSLCPLTKSLEQIVQQPRRGDRRSLHHYGRISMMMMIRHPFVTERIGRERRVWVR